MGGCFGKQQEDPNKLREFTAFEPASEKFENNVIRTAKYTPLTFFPLNLWEQFHKLSNVYFLVIAVLQFTPVSSVTPTAWFPLAFVLVVNMIKEGIEDRRRANQDSAINNRLVLSVSPSNGEILNSRWKDLTVGTILLLKENESLPADVIILATSDFNSGLCYIETKELDGETNLKNKEANEKTQLFLTGGNEKLSLEKVPQSAFNYFKSVQVSCEQPNADLYSFKGNMTASKDTISCENKNVIYRGCTIRNTEWTYAIVVFTGMETKLMKNAIDKKIKRTTLDKLTNQYMLGLFILLAAFCIIGGVLGGVWVSQNNKPVPWYIATLDNWVATLFMGILTFLILMSAFIPISLTVTMEMVKVIHARFVNEDVNMCYEDPITKQIIPAVARTSNLGEDLGRIQYIFSDKTGTLTQNLMEFMKCSIVGVSYGTGTTEIGRAAAMREGRKIVEEYRPPELVLEKGDNFYDSRITNGAWRQSADAAAIERFFLNLAICHTVVAKDKGGKITYQASSPDEEALVIGAKGSGFWFKKRSGTRNLHLEVDGKEIIYEVLNIIEFDSTRKRMTSVVRRPDGSIVVMCKGADSVIYERLRPDAKYKDVTKGHLREFANEGLRTLVLAERELSEQEYTSWNTKHVEASKNVNNKEKLLAEVAEELERDFHIVGTTAIEDKLQEGVPNCIKRLKEAGIQIWILTGDKVETAINIAMACNLVHMAMHLEKVTLSDPVPGNSPQEEARIKEERRKLVIEQLQSALTNSNSSDELALVIDGYALEFALLEEMAQIEPTVEYHKEDKALVKYSTLPNCKAVVCCRVSPKQKAQVVALIKYKKNRITLGIGDGANDVGMILEAHIGVGISGREGAQAVMSSDFALGQFQYLQRLVLIHGRWSFQRISILILYCFYKNVNFALVTFWFNIYAAWSGRKLYDDFYSAIWNLFFTAAPIIVVAVLDKDMIYQSTLLEFPHIYSEVQSGSDFTAPVFAAWIIDGIWSSLVCFFAPMLIIQPGSTQSDGVTDGLWYLSFTIFTSIHLLCNLRLVLVTKTWTILTVLAFWLSIIFYFFFTLVYQELPPKKFSSNLYKMLDFSWGNGTYWASISLVLVLGLAPAMALTLFNYLFGKRVVSHEVAAFENKVAKQQARITRAMPESAWSRLLPLMLEKARSEKQGSLVDVHKARKSLVMTSAENKNGQEEYLGFCYSQAPGESPEVVLCADYPQIKRIGNAPLP